MTVFADRFKTSWKKKGKNLDYWRIVSSLKAPRWSFMPDYHGSSIGSRKTVVLISGWDLNFSIVSKIAIWNVTKKLIFPLLYRFKWIFCHEVFQTSAKGLKVINFGFLTLNSKVLKITESFENSRHFEFVLICQFRPDQQLTSTKTRPVL